MSASIDHPARILFDSNWAPGLLRTLVENEHALRPDLTHSPSEIVTLFETAGLPALAQMVLWLMTDEGADIAILGSGSIDLDQVTQGEFTIESALRLQELYIGNARLEIKPLAWLSYLAQRVEEIPHETRGTLDRVMGEFLRINQSF
jgi:hypothetical protein